MRAIVTIILAILLSVPLRAQTSTAAPDNTPTATAPADGASSATTAPADASGAATAVPSNDSAAPATTAPAKAGKTAPPWAMRSNPLSRDPGLLTIGYENTYLSGSKNKFDQYATPPQGFSVDELRYVPFSRVGNVGVLDIRSLGDLDYRNYLQFNYVPTWTEIEALATRNRFYTDTPQFVDPSGRTVSQFAVEQRLGENFLLSTHHRLDQVDETFEDPLDPLHQRTQYNDVVASGKLVHGFVNTTFSDWHYFDRTGVQPDTDVKRWQEAYDHDFGIQSLSEQLRYLAISQAGAPNGHIESGAFADNISINDKTMATLAVHEDWIDNTVTQDEYYKEQRSAIARLEENWLNWNGSFAVQERSAERVRADHSYVDVPEWQTLVGRVSGRLSDAWHVSVRASSQTLWNAPVMDTDDNADLLWDSIVDTEARIDATADTVSGYASYSFHRTGNAARDTSVTQNMWNVGGNWQATQRINLSTDFTVEQWLADNGASAYPTINDFMPANEVAAVGLNYMISSRAYFCANYSEWLTWNNNPLLLQDGNTTGTSLSLQAQYKTPKGQTFGLLYSPWGYHDSVVDQLDYQAAVAEITVSTPF